MTPRVTLHHEVDVRYVRPQRYWKAACPCGWTCRADTQPTVRAQADFHESKKR